MSRFSTRCSRSRLSRSPSRWSRRQPRLRWSSRASGRGRLNRSLGRRSLHSNPSLLRFLNPSWCSLGGQGLRLSGLGTSLGRRCPRPHRLSRSSRRLSRRRKSPESNPRVMSRLLRFLNPSWRGLSGQGLRLSGLGLRLGGLGTSLGRPCPRPRRLRRSRRRSSRSPRRLSLDSDLSFPSRFPRFLNHLPTRLGLRPSCRRLSGLSRNFIGPGLRRGGLGMSLRRPGPHERRLTRFSRGSRRPRRLNRSPRRLNRRQRRLSRSPRWQNRDSNVKFPSRLPRILIHKRRQSSRGLSGLGLRLSGLGSE
jgi:hypothetical protein